MQKQANRSNIEKVMCVRMTTFEREQAEPVRPNRLRRATRAPKPFSLSPQDAIDLGRVGGVNPTNFRSTSAYSQF